jgi:putative hemolysin
MIPVIIDTDPGIDDAIAIALAIKCSKLDIRLITTVAGNVGIENTTRNALNLVSFFGRPDIQVAITLANFFASASAAISLSNKLEHSLTNLPYARELSVVIVTLILSYLSLVLGELVPKRIGLQKSLGISLSLVGILNIFSIIFTPLIFILTVSTNAMVFILGFSKNKESDDLSKEEMIAVLNNGNLEKPEKEVSKCYCNLYIWSTKKTN